MDHTYANTSIRKVSVVYTGPMMWAMHYRFSRHGGVVIVRPLSRQPSSGTLGRFKVAHEAAQTR